MNGETLPHSNKNTSDDQPNAWAALEDLRNQQQNIASGNNAERLVAPLPIINWDEFDASEDDEKRAFVDAVRNEFGSVGYAAFHKIFDSRSYWHTRWVKEYHKNRQAANEPVYMEAGTRPSQDAVTVELKRLGYQWEQSRLEPEQQRRFDEWRKQVYRVRAGEYIAPFRESEQ